MTNKNQGNKCFTLLTLKRTGFLGDPIWNKEAQKCPLLFSKITNAVTFKLSTKVAHLTYFKNI